MFDIFNRNKPLAPDRKTQPITGYVTSDDGVYRFNEFNEFKPEE